MDLAQYPKLSDEELGDLRQRAEKFLDLGTFDAVSGDVAQRNNPHAKLMLNTNCVWVVSPTMRTMLDGEKAEVFFTFAARNILALLAERDELMREIERLKAQVETYQLAERGFP